jgi:hypothetical protein
MSNAHYWTSLWVAGLVTAQAGEIMVTDSSS